MQGFGIAFVVLIVVFTAMGAFFDWRWRKLPNALTVPWGVAGVLFTVVHGIAQASLAGAGKGLLFSLGGFAVGFGILWVLWLVGGGGGGDVKFVGALGAWLGFWGTLYVLVASSLIAVGASFLVRAWRATQGRDKSKKTLGQGTASSAVAIPYAIPVAAAVWFVLAWQAWRGLPLPPLTV
jgi:prepilin peptidase CpaA